jgi:pimeloyl-ACP methyl ester carboxylesterase
MSDMDDAGRVSRRTLLLGVLGSGVAAVAAGAAVEWDSPTFVRLRGGCGSNPSVPPSTYDVHSTTSFSTSSDLAGGTQSRTLAYSVALPAGHHRSDLTPLVVVLPGLNGGADDLDRGLGIAGFATAAASKLAFVQPGFGDRTYWHGRADGRDPMADLLAVVGDVETQYGVGGARDRRGVLGWSMGGFGALLLAQQHPDLVAAAVGLSPAVYRSYAEARRSHTYTFDSEADWQRYGLWQHLDELRGTAVHVDCGSGDPFAPTVRQLLKTIPGVSGGIESGCHVGSFWRRRMPTALTFLTQHLTAARTLKPQTDRSR